METWIDVKDYEGLYQVSNYGRIKSVAKLIFNGKIYFFRDELILKPRKLPNGYIQVSLCKNNKYKTFYAHRLVACAFLENKNNKPQVNHKNGNKSDNRAENLEWVTVSENIFHKIKVLGYKDTPETREKKSISKRGKLNFFYGHNPWEFREKPISKKKSFNKGENVQTTGVRGYALTPTLPPFKAK